MTPTYTDYQGATTEKVMEGGGLPNRVKENPKSDLDLDLGFVKIIITMKGHYYEENIPLW